MRRRYPRRALTPRERELAAEAWRLARPVIRRFRRRHPAPDYEGFVAERIVVQAPRFDPARSSLATWVRHQAQGACLDAMRAGAGGPTVRGDARGRARCVSMPDYWRPQAPDPPDDGDGFAALIAGLRGPDRELLELRYREGLSQAEIAGRLGLSKSRVSAWHSEVLARLARRLGHAPAAPAGVGA